MRGEIKSTTHVSFTSEYKSLFQYNCPVESYPTFEWAIPA